MYRPAGNRAPARLLRAAGDGATSRWLPPLLVAGVFLDDALLLPRAPSYAVVGALDEPAHLATSVILLGSITAIAARRGRRVPGAFAAGLILAGNLIDADHLPGVFGSQLLTAGTPRPYPHSLLTVAVLAGAVPIARVLGHRRAAAAAAGAAVGVAGHLLRDLATAPVGLFWPVSAEGVTIPHPVYLAALVVAAAVACLGPRSESQTRDR